jgi:hypothetical protein
LQGEGFGNCSGVMADAEVQRSEVAAFLNSKGVETEVVNRMLNRCMRLQVASIDERLRQTGNSLKRE